ncbi:hypothetical protein NP233_g11322 [Leucocoprinus birnbaumii]|uniref:Nephrocystin 3-like N-terminal domain-containing protein n=1 Tax=Leucocoprinus birnbaumii TaxID=56174 RepID=A0AAD5YR31_9AGAR|nr:hypothetical protein NP233_g11322 [Leucocoprinus birnbaumii]
MFSKASNFQLNNPQFNNVVTNVGTADRPGLKKLLEYSIVAASHDSSARWPPPQCHPGTRTDVITSLIKWGLSKAEPSKAIAWVKGPAGVGKSAIAQSVADALAGILGCSFFFSRPNRRDDPTRFFTTLSGQLATRFPDSGYGDIVGQSILRDPTIVEKALADQFRHLFVIPLRQLRESNEEFPSKVVIIDGLDECSDERCQTEIIRIIVESVKTGTTPFRWLILSRLEPHLVAAFADPSASEFTHQIGLVISSELNPQIRLFFTDKLIEVRIKKGIENSWPTAEDITTLVDLSAGLFAHSHALVLFIDDPSSEGPQHQLRIVLGLAEKIKLAAEKHPLAALDFFYDTLVLKRIPEAKRISIRLMLLAHKLLSNPNTQRPALTVGNVLAKSEDQVRDLCRSLHSVMILDSDLNFKFYHASFMDFLESEDRSKSECIRTDSAIKLLFNEVQFFPQPPISWSASGHLKTPPQVVYHALLHAFFKAVELMSMANNADIQIQSLRQFDFRKVALQGEQVLADKRSDLVYHNLCKAGVIRPLLRRNFIAQCRGLFSKDLENRTRYYSLGRPGKEILLVINRSQAGYLKICPHSRTAMTSYMRKLTED